MLTDYPVSEAPTRKREIKSAQKFSQLAIRNKSETEVSQQLQDFEARRSPSTQSDQLFGDQLALIPLNVKPEKKIQPQQSRPNAPMGGFATNVASDIHTLALQNAHERRRQAQAGQAPVQG